MKKLNRNVILSDESSDRRQSGRVRRGTRTRESLASRPEKRKKDLGRFYRNKSKSNVGVADRKFALLADLEQRGLIKGTHSNAADLAMKTRAVTALANGTQVVYTVMPSHSRISLVELCRINTLLLVAEFGHVPLLVIDDVNKYNSDTQTKDDWSTSFSRTCTYNKQAESSR